MPVRTPPGPPGHWLAGNLPDFTRERLDFLTRLEREYGPVVRFRLGPYPVWLISDPDLTEQILVTDSRKVVKHFGARHYLPALGNGLVLSEGDFWLRQRRLSQPAFLKSRVLAYAEPIVDLTDQMLTGWHHTKPVNIHLEMSTLTSAVALKTLFDLDETPDRAAFTSALSELIVLLGRRFSKPLKFPYWVPTPENRRIRAAAGILDRVVDGFIEAGRKRGGGGDLLSALVAARDDEGKPMSPKQLRDELKTLYLAGHETTALILTWTWYLLATHPAVEDKLAAEWSAVLGDRRMTPDDLAKLPYTGR